MVAGQVLMRDGHVLTLNEEDIQAEAQHQAEVVSQRVAADPVHKKMDFLKAIKAGQL